MIIDTRSRHQESTGKKTANFQQNAEKVFVMAVETEKEIPQEFHVCKKA